MRSKQIKKVFGLNDDCFRLTYAESPLLVSLSAADVVAAAVVAAVVVVGSVGDVGSGLLPVDVVVDVSGQRPEDDVVHLQEGFAQDHEPESWQS